jgi:hypothetical protein
MKRSLWIGFPFLIFWLIGCGVAKTKGAAEKVAVNFYEAVKAKNFEEAVNYVGDIGFAATPREKWIGLLQDVNEKVGNLQGYQLGSWGFNTSTGKGTEITLNVSVVYAKASWKEKLTLFQPPGTDKVQITAYDVNVKEEEKKPEENK